MAGRFDRLSEALAHLPCELTKRAIDRANDKLKLGTNQDDLKSRIGEVHNLLREELRRLSIYAVTPDMQPYAELKGPPFGSETDRAFPSAAYDIEEASKCLAFGRSTACVTHLMRALECALIAMAKTFQVPHEREQWNTMIEGIDSKVKSISNQTHGPNWRAERDFYSEAAGHFRFLKDGWRNHAMHGRARYTADQAEVIFKTTKAFMGHLSHRVCE